MRVRYGSYIGRVGALAVALGIGTAVTGPAGIAWATTEGSTDTESSVSSATTDANAGAASAVQTATTAGAAPEDAAGMREGAPTIDEPDSVASADPEVGSSTTEEVAPGVIVSSSGGAHSSADPNDAEAGAGDTGDDAYDGTDAPARGSTVVADSAGSATASTEPTISSRTVTSKDVAPAAVADEGPTQRAAVIPTLSTAFDDVEVDAAVTALR
ncbi:MAG TPA: hypothetical protein VHH12_02770, partial [Mycobacterium sp.]|nr:hypothetical protein [Mycobacterium sp.]